MTAFENRLLVQNTPLIFKEHPHRYVNAILYTINGIVFQANLVSMTALTHTFQTVI